MALPVFRDLNGNAIPLLEADRAILADPELDLGTLKCLLWRRRYPDWAANFFPTSEQQAIDDIDHPTERSGDASLCEQLITWALTEHRWPNVVDANAEGSTWMTIVDSAGEILGPDDVEEVQGAILADGGEGAEYEVMIYGGPEGKAHQFFWGAILDHVYWDLLEFLEIQQWNDLEQGGKDKYGPGSTWDSVTEVLESWHFVERTGHSRLDKYDNAVDCIPNPKYGWDSIKAFFRAFGALGVLLSEGLAVSGGVYGGWRWLSKEKQAFTGPLHYAAYLGDEIACKALLMAGADVCRHNGRGLGPLHCAASRGHTKVCAVLLEAGAYANAVSVYKLDTPLQLFLVYSCSDQVDDFSMAGRICEAMVAAGTDVNATTNVHPTARSVACSKKYHEYQFLTKIAIFATFPTWCFAPSLQLHPPGPHPFLHPPLAPPRRTSTPSPRSPPSSPPPSLHPSHPLSPPPTPLHLPPLNFSSTQKVDIRVTFFYTWSPWRSVCTTTTTGTNSSASSGGGLHFIWLRKVVCLRSAGSWSPQGRT